MVKLFIFPTLSRANNSVREFCSKYPFVVKKVNYYLYYLVLLNGSSWYFSTYADLYRYKWYHGEVIRAYNDLDLLQEARKEIGVNIQYI